MLILLGGMFLGVGFAAMSQMRRTRAAASAVVFHPSDPARLDSGSRPRLVEFYRDT
jgi:hypothetical protein